VRLAAARNATPAAIHRGAASAAAIDVPIISPRCGAHDENRIDAMLTLHAARVCMRTLRTRHIY